MSIDAVVGFWQALEEDVKLREQADRLGAIELDAPDQAFAPLSRLANDAGFACTPDDLRSVGEVTRFWTILDQRSNLLKEMMRADGLEPAAAIALIHSVAKKTGVRCTVDEFDVISKQHVGRQTGGDELTDEQLEAVCGGLKYYYTRDFSDYSSATSSTASATSSTALPSSSGSGGGGGFSFIWQP